MKIAIIGGGFAGLSAAFELLKLGHAVTLYEKDAALGGLAVGWKEPNWAWHLERAYHHLFTNDFAIIGLIKELGLGSKLIVKRPVTATLWKDKQYQLDSPLTLLKFPGLGGIDKIRTGALLALLKINPWWQPLEYITTKSLVRSIGGQNAWSALWDPLMTGKFGQYADAVAASWFWARIKKRTPSLCYIEGGFQTLVDALEAVIKSRGGTIHTNTAVPNITIKKNGVFTIGPASFDRVLLTVPTPLAVKLVPTLQNELTEARTIPHLHAQVLIVESKKPILNNTYWLNVTDKTYPFLVIGAHTNFVGTNHYGGNHITYIGNYLPQNHPYLTKTKEQIYSLFLPFIKKLSPKLQLRSSEYKLHIFTGPFAQPVHERNYSKKAPKMETSIPGLYLANMDSIYPWDRGTNYAVELGQHVSRLIEKNIGQ